MRGDGSPESTRSVMDRKDRNDRLSTGEPPSPRRALRFFLQLVAGVAVIAIGVTIIFFLTGSERAAVNKYVTLLREQKTAEAFDMLVSARKEELTLETYPQKLHTARLAKSFALDIASSGRSSRGKGCVTASLDDLGQKGLVYFYLLDEDGQKRVHSVLTSEDLPSGGIGAVEPWHCD